MVVIIELATYSCNFFKCAINDHKSHEHAQMIGKYFVSVISGGRSYQIRVCANLADSVNENNNDDNVILRSSLLDKLTSQL